MRNSSLVVSATVFIVLVGVLGVVVKLPIAEPAGVGIVRGHVLCMDMHKDSRANRSSNDVLSTLPSSARNGTVVFTFAIVLKLQSKSYAVGSGLVISPSATTMTLISPIIVPEFAATPEIPACATCSDAIDQVVVVRRCREGSNPGN